MPDVFGLEYYAGQLGPGLQLAGQGVTTGQRGTCELPGATPQVSFPMSGAPGVATSQVLGLSREPQTQVL